MARLAAVAVALLTNGCDERPSVDAPSARATVSAASATIGAAPVPAPLRVRRWSFDDVRAGAIPAGWTAPFGNWEVTDQQNLRQSENNASPVFNLLLADARAEDLSLRVRLRASSGKIDQGGGVVWRAQDEKNYYVARYNPLEKNVRAYLVARGKRTQIATADAGIPSGVWMTLEVRMIGDRIEAGIDGKKHLDVRDGTFEGAGRIGLWTKADAVTDFDDLELEQLGG